MKDFCLNLAHFDSSSNTFSLNIKLFYFSCLSPWPSGRIYKILGNFIMILLAVFWAVNVVGMLKYVWPFVFDKFMEMLGYNLMHLMGVCRMFYIVSFTNFNLFLISSPTSQVKDRQDYFEIIEFINARQFKPNDDEVFELRKANFLSNFKIVGSLTFFGFLATAFFILFLSPLTVAQKEIIFSDDERYLYWLMYTQTLLSMSVSSILSTASSFLLSSSISFVAIEYKILAISFGKLLNSMDDELDEQKFAKILQDFKVYVKYYQRLLKYALELRRSRSKLNYSLLSALQENFKRSC